MGLSYAIAFDQETYGERKLVAGYGSTAWHEPRRESRTTQQNQLRELP